MSAKSSITILHVSDMQFGKNHRFAGVELPPADAPFDTLLERLKDDLRKLRKNPGLWPDLLIITGDLAEWGQRPEFEDALDFVVGLTDFVGLSRDRVVIIPGNHDINRPHCKAHFDTCEGDGVDPIPPYWPKWKHYVWFFNEFYKDLPAITFTEDIPRTWYEMPDLGVAVAGLNSTMAESHRDGDHFGHVGEAQLRWFADRLDAARGSGWLRIGAVHHNYRRGAKDDNENLHDADDLKRHLVESDRLNLLLHGHTHDGRLDWASPTVPVLSTGSAALTGEVRPADVPNQYQFIRVWRDRICHWTRAYAGDRKVWIGDTRASLRGDNWWREEPVPFKHVDATFPIAEAEASAEDSTGIVEEADDGADRRMFRRGKSWIDRESRGDDILARVEAICRLRARNRDRVEIKRQVLDVPPTEYLRVTERDDGPVRVYPVGAIEYGDRANALEAFLQVHARYKSNDPTVPSVFVCGGEGVPDTELKERAQDAGVQLVSFIEYQGLIDFREFVQRQTERLNANHIYPSRLYVPQRMVHRLTLDEEVLDNALESVHDWLMDPTGRFILVLGQFGTGKTFLLHELARRLGAPGGPLIPIMIELRSLEKARGLDELVAQQLVRAGMEQIDVPAFRYMLEQGRVVLLFDGFDELVLRVTYDRATEHFETLLQAAMGNAKVIVTSRTEHFQSEKQVRTALGEQFEAVQHRRVVRLLPFERQQIRQFLVKHLDDEARADGFLALMDDVRDLAELGRNPRMLGFIADLGEADLGRAKEQEGEITAASLYRLLLNKWLAFEADRVAPKGASPAMSVDQRWSAVRQIALCLWAKTERTVVVSELTEGVGHLAEDLAKQQIAPDVAAFQVGSGTLLVRDETGGFSFIHQSVMEWLVAEQAAEQLRVGQAPEMLATREMSSLMADFLGSLAPRDPLVGWAQGILTGDATEVAKKNAQLVLGRLNEAIKSPVQFEGQDLRGQDFSDQVLLGANFAGANLSGARLVGVDVRDANFGNAVLVNADLSGAHMENTDLRAADLSEARLLGASLAGAKLAGAIFNRAKLVGASVDLTELPETARIGAAMPVPTTFHPNFLHNSSEALAVALSPDGSILAEGQASGRITLWGVASGEVLRSLAGHTAGVLSVAFSPDGIHLASGSYDQSIRLWDVGSGESPRTLAGHTDWVRSVAFSPDGSRLASGSDDRSIRLWDAASGKPLRTLTGHTDWVRSVAFSPNGSRLASGSSDQSIRLWDVASGECRDTLAGHTAGVLSVVFSPDGSRLASGSSDQSIRLWDAASGESLHTLAGHRHGVLSVAFSPDGIHLASGSYDQSIRLWDVASGESLRSLAGHKAVVWSLVFSPDGSRLVSGSDDQSIRLWDVASGEVLRSLAGHKAEVLGVAFNRDGSRLVSSSSDQSIRLWDVASGQSLRTLAGHTGRVSSVVFSPDGSRLASGSDDGSIRLWSVASGEVLRSLAGHTDWVWSVAFSPDGTHLASGSDDRSIGLWDVARGQSLLRLRGHTGRVLSVVFSPDGSRLASGSGDQSIRLWAAASGEVLRSLAGHTNWVLSVAFSPDGSRLVSGSSDRSIRLWDVASGECLDTLTGHTAGVLSVAFSPDGSRLVSGSHDQSIRLWDVATGECLDTLTGPAGVLSVAFSPDGSRLASGSNDNSIRLWDAASGGCLAVLLPFVEGWVAFTPDGRRYKVGGDLAGGFWYTIGLCRFEPGELDPYMPEIRRLAADEPLWEDRGTDAGA